MSELKPCPFCGEEPEIFDFKDGRFVVQCSNPDCDVYPYTSIHRDRADAIAAWNQRATVYAKPTTLSQLQAENDKLREQMERLVTLLRVDCDIDASWDGLRRFWSIGLTEDGCLMRDRACKAEAENAKLRESVKRLMTLRDERLARAETDNAKLRELARQMYPKAKAFLQMGVRLGCNDTLSYDWYLQLRELGVEVDDD